MTTPLNSDERTIVDILHKAVLKALDRKSRLGHTRFSGVMAGW
jgi:hypothetical protein